MRIPITNNIPPPHTFQPHQPLFARYYVAPRVCRLLHAKGRNTFHIALTIKLRQVSLNYLGRSTVESCFNTDAMLFTRVSMFQLEISTLQSPISQVVSFPETVGNEKG